MRRTAGQGRSSAAGVTWFRWMPDADRLATFLASLPAWTPGEAAVRVGPLRHVIEFRHPTGVTEDVLSLLRAHGVGLCLHDMPGGPTGTAARAVTMPST